jgi:multidrug efflux pump subunit AcrA (membrane-fusion protein)
LLTTAPFKTQRECTVKKLLLFLIVATAAAGAVYYWRFAGGNHVLVESQLMLDDLQRTNMRDVVGATGILEPRSLVLISSEMPGVVQTVIGKVNQTVPEGALLVQLDDRKLRLKKEEADNGVRTAQAALAQAVANRDAAQVGLKTQLELAAKGGFRSDKEQAEAQVRAARAGVDAAQATVETAISAAKEAQLALDLASVRVPGGDSGAPKREYLVLECKVHDGQVVGPQGPPLFVLAGGFDHMEVHTQVTEGDINKIRTGLVAMFKVTTYTDEEAEFRGVVKEIRPQATNIKGAVFYDTVIDVANRRDEQSGEWQLRPGMNVSVDILRREHKNVWRIPTAALNFQLEEAYQSDAVRAKLAQWQGRPDSADWQPLWIWDAAQRTPGLVMARVNGQKNGEPGLKDDTGIEVLEWEPGFDPGSTSPRLITGAPPAHRPGFFDKPANIKVS